MASFDRGSSRRYRYARACRGGSIWRSWASLYAVQDRQIEWGRADRVLAATARRSASVAAGDVLPGDVSVDGGLFGEAEDPLAEEVAHDLGGAAFDGVGAAAEEAADGHPGVLVVGCPSHGLVAEDVHGEVLEAPVVLGLEELGDRAFGTGLVAGLAGGRGAHVGHLDDLALDDRLSEALADDGVGGGAVLLRDSDDSVDRSPADVLIAGAPRAGQGRPLVH